MTKMKGLHAPKWRFKFIREQPFTWYPIVIWRPEVYWKDKYETPRIELEPWISIRIFTFDFWWRKDEDQCEWWIWLHKYNKGNLREALSSWPWRTVEEE